MPDQIKRFLGVLGSDGDPGLFCPTCECLRIVVVADTEAGDRITSCGVCATVLRREPTPPESPF